MASVNWLLNSNIYANNGQYREFYSKSQNGMVYPEITAYAINLLCLLYKKENKSAFLKRAEDCATFLMSISKNGGIPNFRDNKLYTFDTGIFISALLDLYEITKKRIYSDKAEESLSWVMECFDGKKFFPTNSFSSDRSWDLKPSVHLTKMAIPLVKGWLYLNNKEYKKTAQKVLTWAESLQRNGRFLINTDSNLTMLHPHCYATEGFLFAYHHIQNKNYLKVANQSAKWLEKIQNKDGSFYRWYPSWIEKKSVLSKIKLKVYNEKVTDATSQTIRIWKLLGLNRSGIDKAEEFLGKNTINGGLRLVIQKVLFFERKDSKIYSWPTMFYLHSTMLKFGDLQKAKEIF